MASWLSNKAKNISPCTPISKLCSPCDIVSARIALTGHTRLPRLGSCSNVTYFQNPILAEMNSSGIYAHQNMPTNCKNYKLQKLLDN